MFSKIKKLYKKVKFKNNLGFGNNIDNNILNFGFICPGAIKTLKYLDYLCHYIDTECTKKI